MDNRIIEINKAELKKISNLSDEKDKIISTLDIGRLPFFNVEIYFSDDIWKFGKYDPQKGKEKDEYDFSTIHYAYKKYIKRFVLESKVNMKAISSIKKYLGYMKKISKNLCENYVYDCTLITLKCVKKYNELLDIDYKSENEKIHHRRLFIILLKYIETEKKVNYSELRKVLSVNNTALLKAQIESGKTANIPQNIYDGIISLCLKEMCSNKSNKKEIIEASSILLLSQVGMRIHELSLIKADKKKYVECFNSSKKVPYLEFLTMKTVRSRKHAKITKTFLTDKAELAYDTLERLTAEVREKHSSDYIFISENSPDSENPVGTATLRAWLARFIVRNSKELGVINTEYKDFRVFTMKNNEETKLIKKEYCNHLTINDFVSIPNPHQFRVAVCNELIRQGVEIGWIVQHMNHLTVEMTLHYQRSENEKDKELSKGVLEGVVTGEFNLIGEEAELITLKINEFIKENKYNVKTDLKKIIDELITKVPIREKREGFCIKSSFGKKCKYNEFMCAFDICPNICTVYFFADITYKRFKDKLKVIEYDKINNFVSEANIETSKLKKISKSFLIKELEELEREIEKQGIEKIIVKHPQLEYIIANIANIIKEVRIWI